MAFRDFTFPEVATELGLTIADADLFASIPPLELRTSFVEMIQYGSKLAFANNTEAAKAQFIIAPVLLELRHATQDKFKLFSGREFNVDSARGLNGYCDFMLTKGPNQLVVSAPFIAIAEAKNDNVFTGLGQCIAAMFAAKLSNEQAKVPISIVHGVVSTGMDWQFLRLQDSTIFVDRATYAISDLPKIMGILKHIVLSVEI